MGKIVQTAGRNTLGEFAPEFARFNDDVLFGENWNNQDIDVKTRSIITVVALMASGITDSSLKYHLQNAKNHGVTQKEIAAVITHVAFYAGWPKAWAVFNLPILVFYILHHLPVQAIHWNYFRPALLLPDVKTIHPVLRHASVSLLPEY